MNHKFKIVSLLLCILCMIRADEGDQCVLRKTGVSGVCRDINKCQSAKDGLKKRINPQICSFVGSIPIVCCTDQLTTEKPPVATPPSIIIKPTEPLDIPVYDYKDTSGQTIGECELLSPSLTASKTGQKAWDMCVEYQQTLVYPCKRSAGLAASAGSTRASLCHHNADELIVGGEDAARDEFPHMVLLGYGQDVANAQWLCGGSLVSDQFVLTAGHCTESRDAGRVSFAQMGVLSRSQQMDPSKLRRISEVKRHPDYKPPNRYHDIALLKLDSPVKLDQYLVPACIHVPSDAQNLSRASASGWGLTTYKGATSDKLQKVILNKFSTEECRQKFPRERLMKQGFDDVTQTCYGDKSQSRDTCQGDSGGPLQIKSKRIHCMYTLVGVTSFGKGCGFVGEPGIYTRVANYLPWIEGIVWP